MVRQGLGAWFCLVQTAGTVLTLFLTSGEKPSFRRISKALGPSTRNCNRRRPADVQRSLENSYGRCRILPAGLSRAPLTLRSPEGRQQNPLTIPNARGRGRGLAALECSPGGGSSRTPGARPRAPTPSPLLRSNRRSGRTEEACSPRRQGCPGGVPRGSPQLPHPSDLCSRVIPLPRERPGRRFPRSLARGLVKLQQHKCWRTWTNN